MFARFVADWEQMLTDRARLDFEPMLIHGDLAMEHLLVDADGNLGGVIDFGDAMVADSALDFSGFPDELAQSVLALYTDDATTRDGIWRPAGDVPPGWSPACDRGRGGVEARRFAVIRD